MSQIEEFDRVDFFRDDAFVADPFTYFAALRDECPVRREPHHGIVMVTGYEEAVSIYNDTENWSSCVSVSTRLYPRSVAPRSMAWTTSPKYGLEMADIARPMVCVVPVRSDRAISSPE